MDRDKRTRLFIDVGTNCEIVLSDGDRILSILAPAGPGIQGWCVSLRDARGRRCDHPGGEAGPAACGRAVLRMGASHRPLGDVEPPAASVGPGWSRRWPNRGHKVGGLDASEDLSPTTSPRRSRPGSATGSPLLTPTGPEERIFVLHRPAPWTAEPEDCVVLTQRDVRELECREPRPSRPAGRCCSRPRPGAPRRPAGAARRILRQRTPRRPPPPLRIGLVPKLARCWASSPPASSPRRGRPHGAALRSASARAPGRC